MEMREFPRSQNSYEYREAGSGHMSLTPEIRIENEYAEPQQDYSPPPIRREAGGGHNRLKHGLSVVKESQELEEDYIPPTTRRTSAAAASLSANEIEHEESGYGSSSKRSSQARAAQETFPEKDSEKAALMTNSDDPQETEVEEEASCFDGLGDRLLKLLKLMVYVFLFVAVLVCVIISRMTLLYMTRQYGNVKQSGHQLWTDQYTYLLVIILSVPDVIKFVSCFFSVLFETQTRPAVPVIIVYCIQEALHIITLYGFVFRMLPSMDSLSACAIMTATGLVPFLINIISSWRKYKHIKRAFAVFFITLQMTSVSLCFYRLVIYETAYKPVNTKTEFLVWSAMFVLVVSVRWIENYLTNNPDDANSLCMSVFSVRHRSEGKAKMVLVSSLVRLMAAALILKLWLETKLGNPVAAFSDFNSPSATTANSSLGDGLGFVNTSQSPVITTTTPGIDEVGNTMNASITQSATNETESGYITLPSTVILAAVHVTSTWACYHLAQMACKLCMQTVAFAVPLCLASPLAVVVLLFAPNFAAVFLFTGNTVDYMVPELSTMDFISLAVFASGHVSHLFLCRHIWTKMPPERLSFAERLFTLPHYCSPLLDLSLLHSRRREDLLEHNYHTVSDNFPIIKACATMWHENEREMMQFLMSIFRLDNDQGVRRISREENPEDINANDYYEFEVHILFDDALKDEVCDKQKTGRRVPNEYVLQLIQLMDDALSGMYKKHIKLPDPLKYQTPYGVRLEWTLPGRNKMIVHLKDKTKIKNKKRWSQVMYMYNLLVFKLQEDTLQIPTDVDVAHKKPSNDPIDVTRTYILALDGDVDFQPSALLYLLDRMKKNPVVAAACGRIKPKGSGPIVWYQKFEYAVGHWLQKSAEHVFGCVLCSPGCFSLFRGSALRTVMKTYTRKPTTAKHHLQYDQGEDRWLCTLLLQSGYKIEYVAASVALTYAPESFKEFFNQRRRWLPSTMANIADLIQSRARTVKRNKNISNIYILYLLTLFVSSILGPATVLLAMQSSVATVFRMPTWASYLCTYGPTIAFVFVCLMLNSNKQIAIAIILSTGFAFLMLAVTVGTLVSVARDGWITPDSLFLYVLIAAFALAGILHPYEMSDLIWGLLYFLCIPAGYLFLVIYSICNMHVTSWGTRETKSTLASGSKNIQADADNKYLGEAAEALRARLEKQPDSGCCGCITWCRMINAIILFILQSLQKLDHERSTIDLERNCSEHVNASLDNRSQSAISPNNHNTMEWLNSNEFIPGTLKQLSDKEIHFWKHMIAVYLNPNDKQTNTETDEVITAMTKLRNKSAFSFFFLNGLWLVIMTALQEVKRELNFKIENNFGPPIIVHPLGLLFLVVFAILLLLQIAAMVKHRYGTALHVLAFLKLGSHVDNAEYIKMILTENVSRHSVSTVTSASSLIAKPASDGDNNMFKPPLSDDKFIQQDYKRLYKRTRQGTVREYNNDISDTRDRKVYDLQSEFRRIKPQLQKDYNTYRHTISQRRHLPRDWLSESTSSFHRTNNLKYI